MGPSFLEGGPIMYRCCLSVCSSVCLSVLCLRLEGKRKGLGRPNLVGRVPGTRAPRGPISRSRGQRSWILDHFQIFVTIALKGAYGNCWQSDSVSNHAFLGHVELVHCGKCNYSLKCLGEIYITIFDCTLIGSETSIVYSSCKNVATSKLL